MSPGEELSSSLDRLHTRPLREGLLGSSQVFRICSCFFHSLFIVLVALRASGKRARRVIEEQLASEAGGAVTPEEFAAIRRGDGIFLAGAGLRGRGSTWPPVGRTFVNAQAARTRFP